MGDFYPVRNNSYDVNFSQIVKIMPQPILDNLRYYKFNKCSVSYTKTKTNYFINI